MPRIASYVFIDLETTSLPKLEYNKTRITEISMVVVKRNHILDTRPGASPRVQDKFTMCFNPRRMIDPGSTEASGLCNDLLEHQTDFNMNVFNTINGFLQCLEKPVCLVAQNGEAFDFPILKNHFEKLGVQLSDDILCADSLHAFHDIFEIENRANVTNSVGPESLGTQENNQIAENTDQGVTRSSKINEIQTENEKMPNVENKEETTKKDYDETDDLSCQRRCQEQNEKTPRQNKKNLTRPQNRVGKVSRKLYWGNNSQPTVSYKLKNLYERVLCRPGVEAHRAENDCIMAMEISVSIAKQFVRWVDKNHRAFSTVNPMRLGVPLGQ